MRKILYCWFSLLFNLSLAHAATWDNLQSFKWPTCTIPQNDWRVGIGIDVEYVNLEAKVKDKFPPLGSFQFSDREQTQKQFQVAPSLEVGKTSCNDYYTGIIISWHHCGAKKESRAPFKDKIYFTHEFKMRHYFNILAKLGYKVTPKTMAYMLMGPSIAKWSHTTNQFRGQALENTFKISQTSVGLGLGLGVEQVICNGLALSINYTHHFYKKAKKRTYMEFIDNDGDGRFLRPGIISKKVKPSSEAVVVRLAYFF